MNRCNRIQVCSPSVPNFRCRDDATQRLGVIFKAGKKALETFDGSKRSTVPSYPNEKVTNFVQVNTCLSQKVLYCSKHPLRLRFTLRVSTQRLNISLPTLRHAAFCDGSCPKQSVDLFFVTFEPRDILDQDSNPVKCPDVVDVGPIDILVKLFCRELFT